MSKYSYKAGSPRFGIKSYDEILGITNPTTSDDKAVEIPLTMLRTFHDHPFRVVDDEKMEETIESIKKNGVLVPGIVRPLEDGYFEIISGHRRAHACRRAGLATIPMFVRKLDDIAAIQAMVDSNIHREETLFSEKAKAYRMRYDAEKSGNPTRGRSIADSIGAESGESGKTVERYLRLSYLLPELLELVDRKKLGFIPGVEISWLDDEAQLWVLRQLPGKAVSKKQAGMLREYFNRGQLTEPMVELILNQKKTAPTNLVLKKERLMDYFESDTSKDEMEEIIFRLLEEWKEKGEGI